MQAGRIPHGFLIIFKHMPPTGYRYKDLRILLWILVPYTAGMNLIAFGDCFYSSGQNLVVLTAATSLYVFFVFFLFRAVGKMIQRRFPADNKLFTRIAVMLPVFYTMNVLMVSGLYAGYNLLSPFSCSTIPGNFLLAAGFACLASTIVTFLNEAVENWEKWKQSVTETEQLRNAYQKTKLLALKGQLNPHFLFNCFNSLSSLIQEDQQKAEQFLDEMTKVHRYMLRGDEDQLVPLSEELKFARSFLYLINVRFGEAIRAAIHAGGDIQGLFIPPLSLQVILENIVNTNTASKAQPLLIEISIDQKKLLITHSVQTRSGAEDNNLNEGLRNLITKYRLLHVSDVFIKRTSTDRTIVLPLFTSKTRQHETV